LGTKSKKIVFRTYIFVKSGSIYGKPIIKMIAGPFYTHCRIYFTSENASFCDNL